MYRAQKASGFGRTDWVVMGPCSCVLRYNDECGCLRCDGYAVIQIADGLTEQEAHDMARKLTDGEIVRPFNPPHFGDPT